MSKFFCYAQDNESLLKSGSRAVNAIRVGGDKSVTHRALILASMARGVSSIVNPSLARDCMATIAAFEKLGVVFEFSSGMKKLKVRSPGFEKYAKYQGVIDCCNSGTSARLLMGLLAGLAGRVHFLTGDRSLSSRPMARVAEPLKKMGAEILLFDGDRLPAAVAGRALSGIECVNDRLSAQVKTSLLIAGIMASGTVTVVESIRTRDHFERIAPLFGVNIISRMTRRGNEVSVKGGAFPVPAKVTIPDDISSASFYLVLDALCSTVFGKNQRVRLGGVLVNETRDGLLRCLSECGYDICHSRKLRLGGEDAADLGVAGRPAGVCEISPLKIDSRERVVSMIDEIALLALVLAHARGKSVISHLSELRVKESDRLSLVAGELNKIGARIRVRGDSLVIEGVKRLRGGCADSHGDHRLAMMLVIAGLLCEEDFELDGCECVSTSNPGFFEVLDSMGFRFSIQ